MTVPGAELAPPLPRWIKIGNTLVIVACAISGVIEYVAADDALSGVIAASPAVCTILILATYLRARLFVFAQGYWCGHSALLARMNEALDRGMSADEWMMAEVERHRMSDHG